MAVVWEDYVDVPPVTAGALARLEARHRVTLPQDYKEHAMRFAGRVPRPGVVRVGTRGRTPFGPLLFIAEGRPDPSYYSIEAMLEAIEPFQGAGRTLFVPFSTDTASAVLCFDYRKDGRAPPVVSIDYSYDPDERGAILDVAPSFTATLAGLVDLIAATRLA